MIGGGEESVESKANAANAPNAAMKRADELAALEKRTLMRPVFLSFATIAVILLSSLALR